MGKCLLFQLVVSSDTLIYLDIIKSFTIPSILFLLFYY